MSLLFILIMNTEQYFESDLKTIAWAGKVDGSNPTSSKPLSDRSQITSDTKL